MLGTDPDRKYLTQHGQHLNLSGKELIFKKLTMVMNEFFTKKQIPLFACIGKILSLKDPNIDYQKQK